MDVYLASPRGFCAGVDLAVDIVDLAIQQYGTPVYVKHQIVHNPKVVADVEAKGAITVEQVEEVPVGAVVVFSAHGSPPSDYAIAKKRNLVVLDATCPLVTRVHNEAKKYTKEGKKIVLVGHVGHQEVIGTTGQADMTLIDERQDWDLPHWDKDAQVAVLTQTTLSVNDTALAVSKIKKSHPNAIVRDDICYATTERQNAVREDAKEADVVLVVGSKNSSNSVRLTEISESVGTTAHLLDDVSELDPTWFTSANLVLITAGASAPEHLVLELIEHLTTNFHGELEGESTFDEGMTFSMPSSLNTFLQTNDMTIEGEKA